MRKIPVGRAIGPAQYHPVLKIGWLSPPALGYAGLGWPKMTGALAASTATGGSVEGNQKL